MTNNNSNIELSDLIYLDSTDLKLVIQELTDYFSKRFENRNLMITYKSINKIKFFNISEKTKFINQELQDIEIKHSLVNLPTSTVLKIISPSLKSSITNKYNHQMQDKTSELNDFIDSAFVQLKLLNIQNCCFEQKDNTFIVHIDDKSNVFFKKLKCHVCNYGLITHFDLVDIKKMINNFINAKKELI